MTDICCSRGPGGKGFTRKKTIAYLDIQTRRFFDKRRFPDSGLAQHEHQLR